MRYRDLFTTLAALGMAFGLSACDDLLDVSDPERFTDDDLDGALEAVANGAEGAFMDQIDEFSYWDGLISDVFQNTGTWNAWDEIDHGRWQYGTPSTDTDQQQLLQARWFADDARERIIRVLGEAEANASLMMPQVMNAAAYADLYLGQMYCEAPAEPNGPAVSDDDLLRQAIARFDASIAAARAVGSERYELAGLAGRARAKLLLGDHDAAAADAAAVPDGFSFDAIYTESQQNNSLVNLATAGFNRAAGLREKWWDVTVELPGTPHQALTDPWSGAPDPRMPVLADGTQGVDGVTPHFSQWRYTTRGDDIAITDADEMRLIEAEAAWRNGALDEAQAIMNGLRDAAGLAALPPTTSSDRVGEYLVTERLAEGYFAWQMRMADLRRFDLVNDFIERGDFVGTEIPRPIKFSMSDVEARDNTNVVDEAARRCLPTS